MEEMRTQVKQEKASAWHHWQNDVIMFAVEVYLKIEAQRAAHNPLVLPPESHHNGTRLVGLLSGVCPECGCHIQTHSVMSQLSSGWF